MNTINNKNNKYIINNLREVYHELGTFSFKIILNNKYFKDSENCECIVYDSSRQYIQTNIEKWGRKINIDMTICDTTSDGVAYIDIFLNCNNKKKQERIYFWIIKP